MRVRRVGDGTGGRRKRSRTWEKEEEGREEE